MKRLIAAMLAVMMIFMFTACKKSEPAQKEEPTKEVTETAEEPEAKPEAKEKAKTEEKAETTSKSTGIVEAISNEKLTIYSDAKQSITFNVKDVKIDNADKIQSGDKAVVEYKGTMTGNDASKCEVTKVISTEGNKATLKGKVKTIDKKKDVISLMAGDQKYDFDYSKVKSEGEKIDDGDEVEVVYAGVLSGTDTSHAYVKSLKVTEKAEDMEKAAVTGKKSNKSDSAAKDKKKEEAKKKSDEKKAKKAAKKKAEQEAKGDVKGDTKDDSEADVKGDDSKDKPTEDEQKPEEPAEEEKKDEQPAEEEKKDEKPAEEEEKPAADAKKVKVDGVVTEYDDKEKLLTITTKDKKEMVFDVRKAEIEKPLKDAAEKIVTVEYIDTGDAKAEKFEAVKITGPVEEKAAETGSAFSGGSTMILILAVIAIIAGIGIAVSRKGKKA